MQKFSPKKKKPANFVWAISQVKDSLRLLFLVGAFLGKRARLLQWLVFFFFFRQTTDLIAYVPLFTDFTLAHVYSSVLGLRRTQRSRVRVLALVRKFFEQFFWHCWPLSIFFGTVRLFFRIFLLPKGPPFNFLIFCSKLKFQKARRVPPF